MAAVQLPPLPTGSVYGEVVEASPGQGLHFSRGAQTVWFGDSPQVRVDFFRYYIVFSGMQSAAGSFSSWWAATYARFQCIALLHAALKPVMLSYKASNWLTVLPDHQS